MNLSEILSGERSTLAVDVSFDKEQANNNEYGLRFSSPVVLNGIIVKTDDQLVLNAKLSASVIGQCARCLDDVDVSVSEDIIVYLVSGDEIFLEEHDTYVISENHVDLMDLCFIEILNQVPYKLLCKEDCLGMCPVCGSNFNKVQCKCSMSDENIDARFDKLKEMIK
ncbi:MAG: DUF177 domain-containing protein [Proteocatella sp.]|nr:DUF177 domain-containing protein [Proteocatella sp.]MBP7907621.1 DUF177 domain-containing protein [Proteocatella sp.]NCB72265.1 DUF177 domain-containing protein [Clostridia bacterium]